MNQKTRPAPPSQTFPPRPKPNDITRANKPTNDPKRRRHEETNFDPIMEYSFVPPFINSNTKPINDSSKKHVAPIYVAKNNPRTNSSQVTFTSSPHKHDQPDSSEPKAGNNTILTPVRNNSLTLHDSPINLTTTHSHGNNEELIENYTANVDNHDDHGVCDEDMVT